MTDMHQHRLLVCLALGGALWTWCAAATAQDAGSAGASMPRTRALIGDAACDDDSQCRTLAVGSKACGGPEYYLAWSTKRTDAEALSAAAAEETFAQRHEAMRRGLRSTCVIVGDPGAWCAPAATAPSDGAAGTAATSRSCRLRATVYGPGGRPD